MPGKYFLTTPLYYVNSRPHLGHAYTEIAADTLARWHKLRGDTVFFLTGTDEHGQKISRAAQAAGMEPQAFADQYSNTFRDLWGKLDVRYDDFIRTTEPRHREAVRKVWIELEKKGELYTSAYKGFYCTPCETFLTEEYVRQVKSEGKPVNCPDCSRPAEEIEETNYFFKLSKYQEWLTKTVEDGQDEKGNPLVILPETRKNEVLGFLRNNKLEDLCVSRPKNRLAWGIPVPISDQHVTYVWFDALVNYISAVGYGSDEEKLAKWWPADVHLIGKDILRHHAIYWTIILKALDLAPPKMIFAHGWWVVDGKKMSKSLGNAMDPVEITGRFGVDTLRYFILAETPFGSDGTFSEDALVLRYNTNLANDLGNLLNRSLTMCEKYFSGIVPALSQMNEGPIFSESRRVLVAASLLFDSVPKKMEVLAFSEALSEIWGVIGKANKFIEISAPWTLAKEGKTADLQCVILTLAETLKIVAQFIWPFMPQKAEVLWKQLGVKEEIIKFQKQPLILKYDAQTSKLLIDWEYSMSDIAWSMPDTAIFKDAPLFPRIESEEEKAKKAASPKQPKKG